MGEPTQRLLRLGTRRSQLAMAQSRLVAGKIEEKNPGIKVVLVGFETRGDKIQDIPLQQVEGKDFFTAELDSGLLAGEVDINVHSMKDLSLERPAGITLAAVPKRENPRDIVVFNDKVLRKLRHGEVIVIGTSSPRRLENIPALLMRLLPKFNGTKPDLKFSEIRGNVNTRLSRLHEASHSTRGLDGVVLAVAGILRLLEDADTKTELAKYLCGTVFMLLPLRENPTAPAQGALAVECRADDAEVLRVLSKINHLHSQKEVLAEREILKQWGGGCQQRFGATQTTVNPLGELLFIAGKKSDNTDVHELRWNPPENYKALKKSKKIWDGVEYRKLLYEKPIPVNLDIAPADIVFISHSRAVPEDQTTSMTTTSTLFVPGTHSWGKLAELGLWVSGCSEEFALNTLFKFITGGFFKHSGVVHVLTHKTALDSWQSVESTFSNLKFKITPTYEIEVGSYPTEIKQKLSGADCAYFSSGSQFDSLKNHIEPGTFICAGAGKTSDKLSKAGINHFPFPSHEDWKNWMRKG